MPAPALKTRFGRICHAKPSRGAKSSCCGCHKGVPGGASVIVAKLFTCVTVNGRVSLGDEGAELYSHRKPYVIVNVRVAFHVSCANRLQFEKMSVAGVREITNASGTAFASTFAKESNSYSTA